MAIFDPTARPDPERDERQGATAGQVEIRPARRTAHLAVRSLACPSCGVPVTIDGPVGFSEVLACAFCESEAPTREYLRDWGWPRVNLIARL
jgi:hypothetical protein